MIKDFEELLTKAKEKKGVVVGVPSPEDVISINTIIKSKKENIADFILCGNRDKIIKLIKLNGGNENDFEIINSFSQENSASKIVELAKEKRVQVILKGFLSTSKLLKPTLDKEKGLRTGNLFSDILFVENPGDNYDGFLGMTDGGVNILPDLIQKKQMIENAVKAFHKLGYERPKVGILTAKETVNEKMPATIDARELYEMNKRGEIKGCDVYGPIALDIAVSPEAAEHKGITNPVAGHVQIMVVPNIEAGNIFGKSFTYYLKIPVGHVIMGAKIPILIPSRNESDVDKLNSVALGVIIAEN